MNHSENLFILGNPRSGTSLLRITLNCHNNIVIPPESGFIVWWYEKYKHWNPVNGFYILDDILQSKKIETWNLDKNKILDNIRLYNPKNYAEICSIIYLTYASNYNKDVKIIGDKNNYYIAHTDVLNKLYPNAKYIHLIRDVRDVACSYINLNKLGSESVYKPELPTQIEDICKEWNDNNQSILNYSRTIQKENFLTIRYEDFVLDNRKTLLNICNFLGIEFDNAMLSYFDKNREFSLEPKETLDWKMKTLEPLDVKNIGKYSQELSEIEVNTINQHTLNLRKLYQYV
jgi:hypothetical protein